MPSLMKINPRPGKCFYWKLLGIVLLCTVMISLFLTSGCTANREAKSYSELKFSGPVHWPEIEMETFSLDNGITFFLLEDHELPLMKMVVSVRGGRFLVPEDKEGLAQITSEVMRTGGSRSLSGDKLNRLLENKAAEMDISMNLVSGSATLDVLKKDFYQLLPVFVDVLKNPALPMNKILLAKQQLKTEISRRNNEQNEIALREYNRLIYGIDSVYGRLPQYATVENITRKDIVDFHKRCFQGSNLLVGITGDFNAEKIKSELSEEFSIFSSGRAQKIELPPVNYQYSSSINLAHKSGVTQSFILMGHIGGFRQNPDYAALQVMNKILSGGFSGRLFEKIRTEMGLAYAVFGQYGCNYYYPGKFFVGLKTKISSTAQAIKAVEKELKRLQTQGVRPEELSQAKEQFLNSLVFRHDNALEILKRKMYYAYRGMDLDSFQDLVEQIKKVSAQDVLRVTNEYVQPESLQVLVVGPRQELKNQLRKLGELREIDISIPEDKS